MYNPNHPVQQNYPLGNLIDLKPNKGRVFSSAGRAISGQEDSMQRNFVYHKNSNTSSMSPQKPLEKASPMKEKEDIDALRRFQNEANFNNIAQSVPHAYKSYTNNLEKIHGSVNKVDAFTNDMYKAKEKLFEDQLSLANLQKLNRVNAEQHKQHLQNQTNKIRDPVLNKLASPIKYNPNSKYPVPNNSELNADMDSDTKLRLLDQFSAGQNLNDHFGPMLGQPNYQQRIPDEYIYPQNYEVPIHQDPIPYQNPYYAQHQPLPIPQQHIPHPHEYYGHHPQYMPHSMYNHPPPAHPKENNELKTHMQKQGELLEKISNRLESRETKPSTSHRVDPKLFEDKFKDFEKETDLRLQLMKQQQIIEALQRQHEAPAWNDNMYGSQINPMQDYMTSQVANDAYMNYLQMFQNPSNDFNNPFLTPQYNPYDYGNAFPGKHKVEKRPKKKKKRRSVSKSSSTSSLERMETDLSQNHSEIKSKSIRNDKSKDEQRRSPRRDEDRRKTDRKNDKKSDRKADRKTDRKNTEKAKREEGEDRKKNAKRNLKPVLWAIAYPRMFRKDIENKVLDRLDNLQQANDEDREHVAQNFLTWMMNITQTAFTKLFEDIKKTYDFIGLDFKALSKSDTTARMNLAKAKTKLMVDTLVERVDSDPIDAGSLEYLTGLCRCVYLRDNAYTNFELMRIKFSGYGRAEIAPEHSKMIINAFLIVRIFVYELIFKANVWNQKIKWNDVLIRNFKIVACLIYHITVGIWTERLPVINNDPAKLPFRPLAPFTMDPDLPVPEDISKELDMIIAPLTKSQLHLALEDKPWVESIQKAILTWTDKVLEKASSLQ